MGPLGPRSRRIDCMMAIAIKSMLSEPAAQNYSLLGFLIVGLILLLTRSPG
jgi:hypothetical protein